MADSMTPTAESEVTMAIRGVTRAAIACSGHEPSISVFARALDRLVALVRLEQAEKMASLMVDHADKGRGWNEVLWERDRLRLEAERAVKHG